MLLKCKRCGKEFNGRKERKYCSKQCADLFRTGLFTVARVTKTCEWCGKEFESLESDNKRFCSTRCSAFWRNQTYGPNRMGEIAKKRASEKLSKLWKDDDFRQKKINYMKTNNPVYIEGVVEKARQTKLKNGSYHNNYKYGNGKISEYEQKVMQDLQNEGFYYNYAISTKLAKDAFPFDKFPSNYKPDFTNLEQKLCIEIDGKSHNYEGQKKLDEKKEKCLKYLGFETIRFTHRQIDEGEFKKWLNSYRKNK